MYTDTVAHLTIATLGSVEVTLNGVGITTFRSLKNQLLLIYLAVEAERTHQRSSIAGLFWPDQDEKAANLNLRQSLFRLRKLLDKHKPTTPYLEVTRRTLRLDPVSEWHLDVAEFNRELELSIAHDHHSRQRCALCIAHLEQAVALYRGDFLEGIFLDDNIQLEEWIRLNREWLRRQMLLALDDLTEFYAHRRDFEKAHHFAYRQIALDSLREVAHQQLIKLYLQEGKHRAAREQYEQCRQTLWDELGVVPAAETSALIKRLDERKVVNGVEFRPKPNLPTPQTSFIGREAERDALVRALTDQDTRVVTLVGMGGVGKTRLALQVAQQLNDTVEDGVWFVPLESISAQPDEQHNAVVSAIGRVLQLTFRDDVDATKQLTDFLRSRQLILVLDNAEHLDLRILRRLIGALNGSAPQLRLLITSRERLRWYGEHIFQLSGLPVPTEASDADYGDFASVQLFVERARWVSADFKLGRENQSAIVAICRLLDGLPLGIELASTWVEHFDCNEIVAELQRDSDFLTTIESGRKQRHTSLRALFDYSWRLLQPPEQQMLANLSILRGEFSRSATLAIGMKPLPFLIRLTEKSLLRVVAPGRYTLHPVIRHYAALALAESQNERLRESKRRYVDFFLTWTLRFEEALSGDFPHNGIQAIRDEFVHIRQAWLWAIEIKAWTLMLRALGVIGRFCRLTGAVVDADQLYATVLRELQNHQNTSREAFQLTGDLLLRQGAIYAAREQHENTIAVAKQLISIEGSPILNAAGHLYQGWTHWHRWELDAANAVLDEAKGLIANTSRRDPHRSTIQAEITRALGLVAFRQGDYQLAQKQLEEALALHQLSADPQRAGQTLRNLGAVMRNSHQYDASTSFYERSLSYSRTIGDRWSENIVLNNLGDIAYYSGDFDKALSAYQESLEVARSIGNRIGEGIVLNNLGILYRAIGLFNQAEQSFLAGQQVHERNQFDRGKGWSLGSLGLLHVLRGQTQSGLIFAKHALELFERIADYQGILYATLYLGHVHLASEKWDDAESAYTLVCSMAEESSHNYLIPEAMAGLALIALQSEDSQRAVKHCELILPLLNGQPLYGCHRPIWVYHSCYEVLAANNDDRATVVLNHATNLLQRRIKSLANQEHRTAILTNHPHNQTILISKAVRNI